MTPIEPPSRCKICNSITFGTLCPYCNETTDGFNEFMKQVKDYNKDANRSLPSGTYINGKLIKLCSEYQEKN
jgi:hypothetical protein